MGGNPKDVSLMVSKVVNLLQNELKGSDYNVQIQALACLFVLYLKRFANEDREVESLSVEELLNMADNLLAKEISHMIEVRAVKQYINNEWRS